MFLKIFLFVNFFNVFVNFFVQFSSLKNHKYLHQNTYHPSNVRTSFKFVMHTKNLLYGSFRIILFTFYPFSYMNKHRIEGKSLPKLSLTCFMLLNLSLSLSLPLSLPLCLLNNLTKEAFCLSHDHDFLSLNSICIFFVAFFPSHFISTKNSKSVIFSG